MKRLAIVAGFVVIGLVAALGPPGRPIEAQATCFNETGFCVSNSSFLEYFNRRGQVRILGYPISREFTLEGFQVQIFQRVVLQLQGGNVERLNVLDPNIMPMTRANQSVFPASDPALAASAPQVGGSDYARRVVEFVRSVSPDTFNGLPVGFFNLFNTTVPDPGTANRDLVTLLNLEIWGVPTSQPAFDPGNQGFVYQRFQRGIMHFRAECPCTEGILVGEYFKSVITGQNLPPDLAQDMQGSRFFGQYNRGAANSVARPAELPGTNLTGAFEPGQGTPPPPPVGQPTPTPPAVAPTATPAPAGPTATAVPTIAGDALPTVTRFSIDDERVDPGAAIEVTIIASDDRGLDRVEFDAMFADDDDNDNVADPQLGEREFDCDNATQCAKIFTIRPTVPGRYTLLARARDNAGQRSQPLSLELRVREGPATPTPTATSTAAPAATATATPVPATVTPTPTP